MITACAGSVGEVKRDDLGVIVRCKNVALARALQICGERSSQRVGRGRKRRCAEKCVLALTGGETGWERVSQSFGKGGHGLQSVRTCPSLDGGRERVPGL